MSFLLVRGGRLGSTRKHRLRGGGFAGRRRRRRHMKDSGVGTLTLLVVL
jgi:hypothetical protein